MFVRSLAVAVVGSWQLLAVAVVGSGSCCGLFVWIVDYQS